MKRSDVTALLIAVPTVLLLTAASLLAVALWGAPRNGHSVGSICTAPALPGTTVHVTETDMGARMAGSAMPDGGMRLMADSAAVPHGQVSFVVTNLGSVPHELVVLPLPIGGAAGSRPVGADRRIDETGAIGEASASCAAGSGDGIAPGAVSWVTVTLPAGRYELVCNFPGHYAPGMREEFTAMP